MSKPFSLLIKPASADCNLRCTYCFYLDHASLYPETDIHRMSDGVLETMVASYMATEQPVYTFGWQGGEPTLMGVEFFRKVVELQKKYAPPHARIANGLQTNATLIDPELAGFLHDYQFLVGVSLDGPETMHNSFRLNQGAKGTHDLVWKGIECLRKHKVEFNVLTLVNANNVKHGTEVFQYLRDEGLYYHQYIPCVEVTETNQKLPFAITGQQWGDFLCEIFDEWIKNPYQVSVRLFDSLLSFLVDGAFTTCHMMGTCCQYFVVEYNGDIYPCDFFVEGRRKLGNVAEDKFEPLGNNPAYREFGSLKAQWNSGCKQCEHLAYCSGDCLKHRIYNNQSPDTVSWLCQGWQQFYDHAMPRLKPLAHEVLAKRAQAGHGQSKGLVSETLKNTGRNELCFCGSGKKYKKCHG